LLGYGWLPDPSLTAFPVRLFLPPPPRPCVQQRSESVGTALLVLHFILLHWWRGLRDNHTWISVFYPSRDTGLYVRSSSL
jgi:hypothetical protein